MVTSRITSPFSVNDRIPDQIEDDLPQPSPDRRRRRRARPADAARKLQALPAARGASSLTPSSTVSRKRNGVRSSIEALGFDLRHVEDVVDDRQQRLGGSYLAVLM
jgi:hypothetical protein